MSFSRQDRYRSTSASSLSPSSSYGMLVLTAATHSLQIEPKPNEPATYLRLSYADLYHQVYLTSLSLRASGLKPGQILAYHGPNSSHAVILLLAATSIGAIWSSAASDSGSAGVLERFAQFGDALWGIVGVERVRYNGKVQSQRIKVDEVVRGLSKGRANKLEVIVFDYLGEGEMEEMPREWRTLEQVIEEGRAIAKERGIVKGEEKIEFYQAEFDHPIWVLFSSGTTGLVRTCVLFLAPVY